MNYAFKDLLAILSLSFLNWRVDLNTHVDFTPSSIFWKLFINSLKLKETVGIQILIYDSTQRYFAPTQVVLMNRMNRIKKQ